MLDRTIAQRLCRLFSFSSVPGSAEPLEARIAPASFQVTNLDDLGTGSLRDALDQANLLAGADTIDFAPGLHGTIVLASQLTVTDTVSIIGPGRDALTISGNDLVRVLDMETTGKTLTVESVTLAHGNSGTGKGGAIFVRDGGLVLRDSVVTESKAQGRGGGIALYRGSGSVVIQDSVISNNTAANRGGGLFLYNLTGAEVRIEKTTVSGNTSGNRGGGMFLYKVNSPSFTIADSTISENHADSSAGRGGGIGLYKVGSLQVKRTTISNNTAGFSGGGMFFYKCTGTTVIEDSTISGNAAPTGGGVLLFSNTFSLTLRQTTISGNSATTADGGAIRVQAGTHPLTLQNSTVFGNTAATGTGGLSPGGINAVLQSTIVAGSLTGGVAGDDLVGTFTLDHSLVQTPGAATITDSGGNITGQDPLLSPLGDHGGPVLTHGLQVGSPVINAGSNPVGLSFDANGLRRVVDQIDMGTDELQGVDLSLQVTGAPATMVKGQTITYTLSLANSGPVAATGVKVIETLPAALRFDPAENPGWAINGNVLTYAQGTLAAGATFPVSLVLHVKGSSLETLAVLAGSISDNGLHGADANLANNVGSSTSGVYQGILVTAPGGTKGVTNELVVTDISTGTKFSIPVYSPKVKDALHVTLGDFNSDGFDDLLVTTDHGKGAAKVFDGLTGQEMNNSFTGLNPFGAKKGSFAATAALPGGGLKVVFAATKGGGGVRVYDSTLSEPGAVFYPFGKSYKGGVQVSMGDVNADGMPDLVVAQNVGNQVKVFSAADPAQLLVSFKVGAKNYRGGVSVAVGDLNGDTSAEIVTGHLKGKPSTVEVWTFQAPVGAEPATETKLGEFSAFDPKYTGGVRVALADYNLDGYLDLASASGAKNGSKVRVFDGLSFLINLSSPAQLKEFVAYPTDLKADVWIAGSV